MAGAEPGPGLALDGTPPVRLHPGDDVFPALSALVPAYRFPIILAGVASAVRPTVVSQIGWWGAVLIGFVNSSG